MIQKIAVTSGTLFSNRGNCGFAVAGKLCLLLGIAGLFKGDAWLFV
jgi:hypothetical protein